MTLSQKTGFGMLAILIIVIIAGLHLSGQTTVAVSFGLGVALVGASIGTCYMGHNVPVFPRNRSHHRDATSL